MLTPHRLLEKNRAWRERMQSRDPHLFDQLAAGQSPDVLWIGCADSRVPPSQIADCNPGELFVHRNIANVITEADLNSISVLQFAVEALKVRHVIVCGHYDCSGVKESLSNSASGLLGHWLQPIRNLVHHYADELEDLKAKAQWDRCCELNVAEQVKRVADTPIMQQAWKQGQEPTVHGWIYRLNQGDLCDLDVSVSAATLNSAARSRSKKKSARRSQNKKSARSSTKRKLSSSS